MRKLLLTLTFMACIAPAAHAQDGGEAELWAQEGSAQGAKDDAAHTTKKAECFEAFTYSNALMRAENAYVRRKYVTVIEILRPIYENTQCIDDPDTILEIDILLGVAYFETDNRALAETFFMNVLRTEPDHIVGSVITLPETSSRFIEELRSTHAEELDSLRKKSPNTVIESLYVEVEKEKHPYWINFMPLGMGLFQHHRNAWGIAYASMQASGIVLSILGGGMVEYYRGDNYLYSHENYGHAKSWQAVQITGIALLGAGYVASVIHALLVHEDQTMIIHSPTQTRPDLTAAAPFVLPDGAGLAFTASF